MSQWDVGTLFRALSPPRIPFGLRFPTGLHAASTGRAGRWLPPSRMTTESGHGNLLAFFASDEQATTRAMRHPLIWCLEPGSNRYAPSRDSGGFSYQLRLLPPQHEAAFVVWNAP